MDAITKFDAMLTSSPMLDTPENVVLETTLTATARRVGTTFRAVLDADTDGDETAVRGHTLDLLAHLRFLREEVETDMRIATKIARHLGMTWEEIGKSLHVSKQAAYQRYGKEPK